ncbi:MAG TPA: VWA domain-containing protein [Chthonomonadaceae bacterium]|nr:VWA domain-containing protein [Chthonomonadaceae bacterium]
MFDLETARNASSQLPVTSYQLPTTSFELETGWDRPARSGPEPSQHVLRVRVRPSARAGSARGIPLRLAIALDTSSSMEGDKIAHARSACRAVLAQLRPEDRISLAGFANEVTPLLDRVPGGAEAQAAGDRAASELRAYGVTRAELALDWLEQALPQEPGTVRLGILISDGRPTDAQGRDIEALGGLLDRAVRLGEAGVALCTVGLGDAANFNTAFLVDLSDRARGAFLYADSPDGLEPQLRARLAAGQSIAGAGCRLALRPLLPGVAIKGCCAIRPEFLPLEISGAGDAVSVPLAGLAADGPTDLLVSVEAPAPGIGDVAGDRPVLAVGLCHGDAGPEREQAASLRYTESYLEAQRIDAEINRDRLQWELNVSCWKLNRTTDVKQTAALLEEIAYAAGKAGQNALAIKATGQLEALQRGGRLDAHRATGMLVESRRPDGAA